MKKIMMIVVMLMAYSFVHAQNMPGMNMNKEDTVKTKTTSYYTCVMHPEIHASKPGNCPKCGMTLYKKTVTVKVPVTKSKTDTPNNTHTDTSMHMDSRTDTAKEMGDMKMPARSEGGNDTTHNNNDMGNMNMPVIKTATAKRVIKSAPPKTVHYDLYVKDTTVNFAGKNKRAIAVNGQIPMPTLTFTEGDTAEILVHNEMDEETSLHWHGLMLPNKEDGVPYITQMPIKPHSTYLYRFPIIQNGTHWYHSHTELQEQIGMYGSLILNKKSDDSTFREGIDDLPTIPIVLSEWLNMKPEEAQRSLHYQTDWFAIQKGTTQSYSEAIGSGNLKTKLTNEWKRMNAMDVSDIAYDKFLINGKNQYDQPQFKAGDKVRLRIANGGASSYFWLTYSGGKIAVVANDGNDVEPVEVDRLIIGVSETYDVVVTIPDNMSYEFLATPEDRTKSASLWLGSGMKMPASRLPKLKYFEGMKMMNQMMKMNGDLDPSSMGDMQMSNQTMDMNAVMYPEITGEEESHKKMKMPVRSSGGDTMQQHNEHNNHSMQMPDNNSMPGMDMGGSGDIVTLNYGMLRATHKTTLPDGPVKELHFNLTGNMNRYVWSIDNKVVSEADKILIKKGENVRIIMYNNSMMRHPMHLHGHDFRVLNGQGDYAPLKNVLDIMPMERDTIEFAANTSGDWFFHCHILYHMMSGMGRVFSYTNVDTATAPSITDAKLAQRKLFADDRMFHFMAKAGLETNGSDGSAMFANTRWKLSTLWHLGYHSEHGFESETMFGRYLGKMQWIYPYVGFDYHYKTEGPNAKGIFDWQHSPKNIFGNNADEKNLFGQTSNKNDRHTAVAGIAFTLPTLTIADFRVDGDGKLRFQLSREDLAVTPRLRFSWMINTDKEYTVGLRYIATKYISLSSHYDSDMGLGAGVTFTY
ncbi:copper oxidase [Panacibacter ginsenosidivorans]|uniref:Copper oxidase n=2 Tax=Panacibacter ginsenosidivorans TaxID=1813871 RepID=A0A5B8VFE1_9BACT|nr:copper oxidase [Panacibacter ginsenosidivorans]